MVQCVTFLPALTQVRLALSAPELLPGVASVCPKSGSTVASDAEHMHLSTCICVHEPHGARDPRMSHMDDTGCAYVTVP